MVRGDNPYLNLLLPTPDLWPVLLQFDQTIHDLPDLVVVVVGGGVHVLEYKNINRIFGIFKQYV